MHSVGGWSFRFSTTFGPTWYSGSPIRQHVESLFFFLFNHFDGFPLRLLSLPHSSVGFPLCQSLLFSKFPHGLGNLSLGNFSLFSSRELSFSRSYVRFRSLLTGLRESPL